MRMEDSHVIYTILLNNSRAPFSDMKARQAAAYALDKKAITEIVTTGLANPANTVLPSGLDYHDKDYAAFAPDMEKAKQLITESGMSGKEVKIPVTAGQATQQIALFMHAKVAKCGTSASRRAARR